MPPVFWAGVGVLFHACAFKWQKSMQNCRPASFFLTNTTTLHHALWLGLIAPVSSISHRWFQTSSTRGRGIHLNLSLKGVSSVTFIMCSVEWVQPNSTWGPMKTHCGTWPRASGWHPPAPEAKSLTHSNPVHQIVFHAFAWQSIWGMRILGLVPPPATGPP